MDPAPDTGPEVISDLDSFKSLIRAANNVAWRNFNVVEPSALTGGGGLEVYFHLGGAADEEHAFDLEILVDLPGGMTPALVIPAEMAHRIRRSDARNASLLAVAPAAGDGEVPLLLAPEAAERLPSSLRLPRLGGATARLRRDRIRRHTVRRVPLGGPAQPRVKARITLAPPGDELFSGAYSLAVRQLHDGFEVGRITWSFRSPRS
jgi:hypothetical protein